MEPRRTYFFMKQLTDEEKSLIRDAQCFVYHVTDGNHDVVRFTFSQLITAISEGYSYIGAYGGKHNIFFDYSYEYLIWRVGLPDYMPIEKIPELKLLLDSPNTKFPCMNNRPRP